MKKLDFNPSKSTADFRKNYKLHDLAEYSGKNLLTQWGIDFKNFGDDKRFEKVWEKGEDKPDVIINYKGKSVLLDWKGKRKPRWIVNKRAIDAYEKWSEKYSLHVIITFFVFDENNVLKERRFAFLKKHSYIESSGRQWDKNKTVEFNRDLPEFTKANMLDYLVKF